jgi:hypothetical protein
MSLLFTLTEVGGNVVFSGTGTVNTAGLGASVLYNSGDDINSDLATIIVTAGNNGLNFAGISGPVTMGVAGTSPAPSSSSGDLVGVNGFNLRLYLPTGYVSGTQLDSTATYNGTTLAGIGFTLGTYTYTWGAGGNADSLTVQIGPAVTPTPTNTPTNTSTPTKTPTNTPTKTSTPTNTVSPTKTSTPSSTATNTPTPSNTPGVCKTYQLNGGNSGSSFLLIDCDGNPLTVLVGSNLSQVRCATFVNLISGNGSRVTLGSCPLPSSTPTPTPSITPSNTATPSVTPTKTATNTPTPTKTATSTPTNTVTQTPTKTSTPSNTPSVTPSITASNTVTPTKTPTTTPTNTVTPTKTATSTPTPTKTATNTPTSTVTPTKTSTPTPTPTRFGVFDANEVYDYGTGQTGSFSGGTWESPPFPLEPPHPSDWVPYDADGEKQGVVVDLSAIQIGGFNGLNN